MPNLFDLPGLPLPQELVTVLAESKMVRVERIISTGQTTGWYDQEETEFVALLQGEAVLEFVHGEKLHLKPGDTCIIEPHQRHRVCSTSTNPACIWLCVFWK